VSVFQRLEGLETAAAAARDRHERAERDVQTLLRELLEVLDLVPRSELREALGPLCKAVQDQLRVGATLTEAREVLRKKIAQERNEAEDAAIQRERAKQASLFHRPPVAPPEAKAIAHPEAEATEDLDAPITVVGLEAQTEAAARAAAAAHAQTVADLPRNEAGQVLAVDAPVVTRARPGQALVCQGCGEFVDQTNELGLCRPCQTDPDLVAARQAEERAAKAEAAARLGTPTGDQGPAARPASERPAFRGHEEG
jgi:hypothetical protein